MGDGVLLAAGAARGGAVAAAANPTYSGTDRRRAMMTLARGAGVAGWEGFAATAAARERALKVFTMTRGHAASSCAAAIGGTTAAFRRGIASSSRVMVDDRFDPVIDDPELEAKVDAEYRKLAEEIKKSPKKQQRHLLFEALKGTRLRPMFSKENEMDEEEDKGKDKDKQKEKPREFMVRIIDINRTNKVTKQGSTTSYSCLLIVGNGDGIVGFSTGKGPEVLMAMEKAYKRATRSLVFVERYQKATIYHEVRAKHCKTKIYMKPVVPGGGMRCNQIVEAICDLAGITDISAKVHGSHHPLNTVRATFEALERVESPEDMGVRRGVMVFKI